MRILRSVAIFDHFDPLQGDKSASDHSVQHWQELIDSLLRVHNLDHDWQVHGETEDFRSVQAAGFAETHRTAQNGRTGEVKFARLEHNGFVQRVMLPAIAFADK